MASVLKHKIIKTVGYIPVILCLALFGWSYYAYIIVFCGSILPQVYNNEPLRIILMVLAHILIILSVWSYIQVVFVYPGTPSKAVSKLKHLSETESDPNSVIDGSSPVIEPQQFQKIFQTQQVADSPNGEVVEHQLVTVKNNGERRYCRKCDSEKPDRTHHCSMCGECVLKMDHHCPWINNCVGFHNQKFFLLFIFYTDLYCLLVSLTLIPGFVAFASGKTIFELREFQLVFLGIIGALFGIVLLCFTGYHTYMLLTNRTTIENLELTVYKGDRSERTTSKTINVFDIGYQRNLEEVLGKAPALWFVPIKTTLGDGILFPISSRAYNLLSSRDQY